MTFNVPLGIKVRASAKNVKHNQNWGECWNKQFNGKKYNNLIYDIFALFSFIYVDMSLRRVPS